MSGKQEIDFGDIQGVVRFAHGRLSQSCFLLVKIENSASAKAWIADAPVSTAEKSSPVPNSALQLAFTPEGLRKLDLNDDLLGDFSDEFTAGMTGGNRPRRFGDTGGNSPERWGWGGDVHSVPDLLVMLYALPGELGNWQTQIINSQFDQGFSIQQKLVTNGQVDREPFGFADGISQPDIDWSSQQSTGIHDRPSYSNLLAPGEILLGYPNEYGEYTDRPLILSQQNELAELLSDAPDKPGYKDFGRNGCYLVVRQLQQHVHEFWRYIDQASAKDPKQRIETAESMVGRKLDGSSIVPLAQQPIAGIDVKNRNRNKFNYDTDVDGTVCPIGAHIRRTNPRTGDLPAGPAGLFKRIQQFFGFDRDSHKQDLVASSRFHRILRRGRPYGDILSPDQAIDSDSDNIERGLHFMCIGANIARQFEFVQSAWINNAKFGGLPNERDPLLGSREPLADGSLSDSFSRPRAVGPRRCLSGLPQFIRVRGGAYFFMPGIRALKYISQQQPEPKD